MAASERRGNLAGTGRKGKVVVRLGLSFRLYLRVRGARRNIPGSDGRVPRNPRFEREVKVAPYFIAGDRKMVDIPADHHAVDSIRDDRTAPAERHAVGCTTDS